MFYAIKIKKILFRATLALFILLILFVLIFGGGRIFSSSAAKTGNDGVVDEHKGVSVPVLMYHDILKSSSRQGEYTITPAEFEKDIKFLKENGYQSILVGELIDFVEKGTELPEKPVLITFDDGHYNNIYYAQPILEEYGFTAVMYVVGAFCEQAVAEGVENPNYSYVTWERLGLMAQSGVWEIQSHSWDMHSINNNGRRGVLKKKSESEQEYINALKTDFIKITEKIEETTGVRPVAFAYPFGDYSSLSEQTLKELGYKITMFSESGNAVVITGESDSLYKMNRYNRGSGKSAASLLKK